MKRVAFYAGVAGFVILLAATAAMVVYGAWVASGGHAMLVVAFVIALAAASSAMLSWGDR